LSNSTLPGRNNDSTAYLKPSRRRKGKGSRYKNQLVSHAKKKKGVMLCHIDKYLLLLDNVTTPKNLIESHGMNSNGKRLPTAMELSLHKVQRERQQALLEQRQMYGLNGAQGTTANVRNWKTALSR
jgi:hypothetical protein